MLDAIRWVKPALANKDIVLAMKFYLFSGGYVHAHDGRMTAAHPVQVREEFLVAGEAFEALLGRLPGEPLLQRKEDSIVVKSGRYRGNVQTLDPALWGYPPPAGEWEKLPADVADALRTVAPFVSDNATKPWALCACLRGGYIYASDNIVVVRRALPIHLERDVLIPFWALQFILSKPAPPVSWMIADNFVAFCWENGAWMRTQVFTEQYPEQVDGIITKAAELASTTPALVVTPDWVNGFDYVAGLSDGILRIEPDKIRGQRDKLETVVEVTTPVTKETIWDARFATPALKLAKTWYPDGWPAPCYFEGSDHTKAKVDGVILGRRI